jgi:L-arabinose isomerase
MEDFSNKKIWFLTGTQHLYGEETLNKVQENSKQVVCGLNESNKIPLEIV